MNEKKTTTLLLWLLILVTVANASILFRQTSTTTCSDFKNFNRGKNDEVGGETCQQVDNSAILIRKPANSVRAELRGIKGLTFEKGKKYYIRWDFMLSSTVTNNAIFQWKSYGSDMRQNFPVVIKFISGELNVIQFQDPTTTSTRENVLFRKKLSANQWYSQMLAIYVSDQNEGGTVEYWFEGYQQDLYRHGDSKKVWPCRTFDGTEVDSKFGIYGAHGIDVDSSIRNLLVGETLGEMNYDKGPSSAADIHRPSIMVFATMISTLVLIKGLVNVNRIL